MIVLRGVLVILCVAALLPGAEGQLPGPALDRVAIIGADQVTPAQVRSALASESSLRQLAYRGASASTLAQAAAPLVVEGYRAAGFAAATVTVDDAALVIAEGVSRTWARLTITAPSPESEALAARLLTTSPAATALWEAGQPARFDARFVELVTAELARGWTAAGRPRPDLAVTVVAVDERAAECRVVISEPAPRPIIGLRIVGAVSNTPEAVIAWLAAHTALKAGAPADQGLATAACATLVASGRIAEASATVADTGEVTVTVREHPLLPSLDAELTPWQLRWLDLSRQMAEHFETGSGIELSGSLPSVRLSTAMRLSRTQGSSVLLDAVADEWGVALHLDGSRVTLARLDQPPMTTTLARGGVFGVVGLLAPTDPEDSLSLNVNFGFRTQSTGTMEWTCSPVAMLATAARDWQSSPHTPGVWHLVSREGESQHIAWDDEGCWQSWDFVLPSGRLRLRPAPPLAMPDDVRVVSAAEFRRALLRLPSAWVAARADLAWDDVWRGLAAALIPFGAMWPEATPEPEPQHPFHLPSRPDDDRQNQVRMIGSGLAVFADHLAAVVTEAWPAVLCAAVGATVQGDAASATALVQTLRDEDRMGPLGRLLQAELLQMIGHPLAAEAARQGLAVCTAARAWDDVLVLLGGSERAVTWALAIDDAATFALIAPAAQRPLIIAELTALQATPPAAQAARLATAFAAWWETSMAAVTHARLSALAGVPGAPANDIVP